MGLVPQVFDLWADPQERYDVFMNNFTEKTWLDPVLEDATTEFMKTYAQYPPRKAQGNGYPGPITIGDYEKYQHIREALKTQGFKVGAPGGD